MKTLTFAAIAALIPFAAAAEGALNVTDAYARGANPMAGAAFMTIENHGDADCQMIGAASDVAKMVELHTHKEEDGVMKMMRVDEGFTIPAHGSHALARGGDHVMFMGLHQPFENGQIVPVTLDFGDCGTLSLEVTVDNDRKPMMGQQMMHGGHGMHGMQGMGGMQGKMPAPSN